VSSYINFLQVLLDFSTRCNARAFLLVIIKYERFPWYGPFRPSCFSFIHPPVGPTGTYGRRVQLKLESNPFLVEQRFPTFCFLSSLSLYFDRNLSWEISIRIMSWGISIGVHVVLISQCRPAASRRRQSDP
jgi:hypothetical protein